VSKEPSNYELDLMAVQEVRWESGGTDIPGEYTLMPSFPKERKVGTK
jgi:hypothetical protein